PPPGGQYPPPGGQYPPPGGQYPPPGDQYPPPGGQYPPPGGQYPPPGGQYPPPGGQYPAPQMPINPGDWMPLPQVSNCPPGLEYLTQIDHLLVKQKVELLEAVTTFETKNKYKIKNSLGQQVYYAKEDTDCCTRNCCGPKRPFDMRILDNLENEVIHLNRPLACDTCFFPCCLQSIEVTAPPGNVVGSVQQEWSILSPKFSIRNAGGDTVLTIEGPMCTYSFCGDVEFKVMSADGNTQVGKISKQWSGMLREMFTDTDYFGITFPMDLDVHIKAVLLGAAFLIDFMFFEQKGRENNDGIGMLS
ncbi:UNVERIFIED_CONTAM: hypothetical protein GTU68_048025, partial [Idotea baltica]|nr:hypothetical protein [Idotea baltica]